MTSRICAIAIDALDPALVAEFWSTVLGWQVREAGDDGWVVLADPEGNEFGLLLRTVQEAMSE